VWRRETGVGFLDADLVVDGGLLVFYLLLEVAEGVGVGGVVVCSEDLDVSVDDMARLAGLGWAVCEGVLGGR